MAAGQVLEPDRPHKSLHVRERRPKTKTLVTGLRAREGRTCLQNRWGDESPPAGSIPVRLRYEIRALTSADARDRSRGGSGKTGLSGSEKPVTHTSLSRIHKSSPTTSPWSWTSLSRYARR